MVSLIIEVFFGQKSSFFCHLRNMDLTFYFFTVILILNNTSELERNKKMKKQEFIFQKQNNTDPLYKQVADYLHGLISSDVLKSGEQLPSEVDLAETLQVSRLTLRKSLSILRSRDLIVQKPHCGTFIAEQKPKHLRIGLLYQMSVGKHVSGYRNRVSELCRNGRS